METQTKAAASTEAITAPLSDAVLEAVRKENIRYNNTDFAKQPPIKIGNGRFYVVTFKGEDKEPYVNFVYTRNGREEFEVYSDLRQLVVDKAGGKLPLYEESWIRVAGMFVVVVLLLLASVGTALMEDGKAFTAFMSAFTAALGYLAGKGTSDAAATRTGAK
jgi:hypothetical protein